MIHNVAGDIKVSGSVDAFTYDIATSTAYPTEIKSIAARPANPDRPHDLDRYFSTITEPPLEYKSQLKTYMWLVSKKRQKDPFLKRFRVSGKEGYLVYMSKGYEKNPIKIFKVSLDKHFIKRVNSQMEMLKVYVDTGTIPDMLCSTKYHPLAKECIVKDTCFKRAGRDDF